MLPKKDPDPLDLDVVDGERVSCAVVNRIHRCGLVAENAEEDPCRYRSKVGNMFSYGEVVKKKKREGRTSPAFVC